MTTSRDSKRAVKDAKDYVKETSGHVRRARDVSDDVVRRVEEELNNLRQAIASSDVEAIQSSRAAIDALLEEHFDISEKGAVREYVESIGLAIIFALILRAFVVEAFKIPSGSMIPTLLIGDHIFVNKFIYGVRVPFTQTYLVEFAEPQRGEVVVFTFPGADAKKYLSAQPPGRRECIDRASLEEDRDFIKRIVGLAGDTIEVRNNLVYVNGKSLERVRVSEEPTNRYMSPRKVLENETNGDEAYAILYEMPSPDFGPIKVKEGHVFAMGDHRDGSSDSRCWGQVPVENIKGRAIFIWFSIGDRGIRWERLGEFIH